MLKQLSQFRYKIKLLNPLIRAFTIDGFQGRDAHTVIISTVRRDGVHGFLADKRRINVALSRAKDELYIVSDRQMLEKHHLWRQFFF